MHSTKHCSVANKGIYNENAYAHSDKQTPKENSRSAHNKNLFDHKTKMLFDREF